MEKWQKSEQKFVTLNRTSLKHAENTGSSRPVGRSTYHGCFEPREVPVCSNLYDNERSDFHGPRFVY